MTERTESLPAAAASSDVALHATPKGYWNLVAQQFRKNTVAVISLYMIGLLFLTAAWAVFLANDRPFIWTQKGITTYPLFTQFLSPEYNIDLVFNFACLASLTVPFFLGLRWLLQKALGKRLPLPIFLSAALLVTLAPFLCGMLLIKTKLDQKIPYTSMVSTLDASKGERAVFTFYPQDPSTLSDFLLKSPDKKNWLGTDSQGRDVLARMLHGARISLSVGFVAEGIAVLIGILMGALAGFYRGWIDIAISRFIEVVICFPTLFLILIIIAYSEKRSIFFIMVVIGLTGWTGIARLVRGEFLKLSELEYVQSARALGASSMRLMFRHILPNAMGPVLVAGAFGVAGAILTESALSYLGFGAPPPTPSWGEMISQGNANLEAAWWMIVFPGLSIFLTVTVYNLAGDGLRDAMDPKMRH